MNRNALLGKALLEVLAEFAVFAALLFVDWPDTMGTNGT